MFYLKTPASQTNNCHRRVGVLAVWGPLVHYKLLLVLIDIRDALENEVSSASKNSKDPTLKQLTALK